MDATNVLAGEEIVLAHGPDHDEETVTVGQSCDPGEAGGFQYAGHHYCATHRKHFVNNLATSDHERNGRGCRFVWMCHQHGPEQP